MHGDLVGRFVVRIECDRLLRGGERTCWVAVVEAEVSELAEEVNGAPGLLVPTELGLEVAADLRGLQVAGALVSALAALVFAYLTVRQTSKLRREDRLARLAELVGDYAEALLRTLKGERFLESTRLSVARLAASVNTADEPLPACRAPLAVDLSGGRQSVAAVTEVIDAAVDELAHLVTAT